MSFFLPHIADGDDKQSPFKNCLRNNYRHLRKWAKRTQTNAFRIYDRDIPRYPLSIDIYGERLCLNYFPRSYEPEEPSNELKNEVEGTVRELFSIPQERCFWKSRLHRAKTEQYEKRDAQDEFFVISEYGVLFYIHLANYIDTGLFLDHRETRQKIAALSSGKSLLNLFSYTCSFSVQAAVHGAIFTKSVDMSNTYTEWGRRNFELNNISPNNHLIIRADCLHFLDDEYKDGGRYDIIVIDPPTISRSKKMTQFFDVQRDYSDLIIRAGRLLRPGGMLFFSTNLRTFKLDESLFPSYKIRNMTASTIPEDFRNRKIHQAWIFSPSSLSMRSPIS